MEECKAGWISLRDCLVRFGVIYAISFLDTPISYVHRSISSSSRYLSCPNRFNEHFRHDIEASVGGPPYSSDKRGEGYAAMEEGVGRMCCEGRLMYLQYTAWTVDKTLDLDTRSVQPGYSKVVG